MTKKEKIKSIKEFITDTKEVMEETPVSGIPGTCIASHSVMKGWIKQAEQQIQQLENIDSEGEA